MKRENGGHEERKTAELGLGAPREDSRWHSRGYLPHCDSTTVVQTITFRLADSLPQTVLGQLSRQAASRLGMRQSAAQRRWVEQWLGAGIGCCALRHPALASLMQATLLKWDGDRYRLLAWCVMPNHVHVMIEPLSELARIVQSWKSYTGRWALARSAELGLGVGGPRLWMREYWDRFIRDEKHFRAALEYIHGTPAKAGLVLRAEDWAWSSASCGELGSGRVGGDPSA
jgi:type I restriction enzyme R subunit/putative DNA methylase